MGRNLSSILKESLDPWQLDLIQNVAEEANGLGLPLYIVGGFVRDLLLGERSSDFDLVVEGDALSLARILQGKYGGSVTIHSKFGTAKWNLHGSKIGDRKTSTRIDRRSSTLRFLDLISARSEVYKHPASLPTVEFGKIEDDLGRRDFTINTLAIRLDGPHFGALRDDFSGVVDVQKGIVRVLHRRSFIDDPTRMFRAVRYEQRLGFKIDVETEALIPEARSFVDKLSAHRIRHELDLILDEPKPAAILRRLAKLDLLSPIHAVLQWNESINRRMQAMKGMEIMDQGVRDFVLEGRDDHRLMGWLLWLLELSDKQIRSLNKHLHFTAAYLETLLATSRLFIILPKLKEWKPSKCVEYLDDLPLPAIRAIYLATTDRKLKLPLEKYIEEWRFVQPRTTGNDLKRLGLRPGPNYRTILRDLRNAWLDHEIIEEEEERRNLEEILRGFQD